MMLNWIRNEPVAFFGMLQAALLALVTVLVAFEVWTPTDNQIAALTALYTAVTAIAIAYLRSKVTPVSKEQ